MIVIILDDSGTVALALGVLALAILGRIVRSIPQWRDRGNEA